MVSRFSDRKVRALTLAECAAKAYQDALSEGLPLARIAQRHPMGAEAFFADSLLRLGAVFGRSDGEPQHVQLTRERIATMSVAEDFSGLKSQHEPHVNDLRVPPNELKRYMAWARTVQ